MKAVRTRVAGWLAGLAIQIRSGRLGRRCQREEPWMCVLCVWGHPAFLKTIFLRFLTVIFEGWIPPQKWPNLQTKREKARKSVREQQTRNAPTSDTEWDRIAHRVDPSAAGARDGWPPLSTRHDVICSISLLQSHHASMSASLS